MKPEQNPILKALLVAWSVLFFLYALVGAWLGTGKYALAGPSTPTDDLFMAIWVGFALLQLVIAILLFWFHKQWLFWVSVTLAIMTAVIVFGGPLLAPILT